MHGIAAIFSCSWWKTCFVFGVLTIFLFLLSVLGYAQVDTIAINLGGTPVNLSVSATNKTVLTRMLTRENVRRAAQNPPLTALTLEQYVRDVIVDAFRGLAIQAGGFDHIDACVAFKALTAAQQTTITTNLGGNNPCP